MPDIILVNKRLRVLDPRDRAALYDRPVFTDAERVGVFVRRNE